MKKLKRFLIEELIMWLSLITLFCLGFMLYIIIYGLEIN